MPNKKNMDMISIRKTTNRIHFDFYYNCPNTGERKRNRKTTGLVDSCENRMVAQQMAIDFLSTARLSPSQNQIRSKLYSHY